MTADEAYEWLQRKLAPAHNDCSARDCIALACAIAELHAEAYARGAIDSADYAEGYAQAVDRAGHVETATTLRSVVQSIREMATRARCAVSQPSPSATKERVIT